MKKLKLKLIKKPYAVLPRACPFCGGRPKLSKCGDQKEFLVVLCSKCYNTPVQLDEARVLAVDAIRIYNERALQAEQYITIYNNVMR